MQNKLLQASILVFLCVIATGFLAAQTPGELETQIDQTQTRIEAIDKEIETLRKQLDTLGYQNKTLQETINGLELQRKTLTKDIEGTEYKIQLQQKTIAGLDKELEKTLDNIDASKATLGDNFRQLYKRQYVSAGDIILSGSDLSTVVKEYDQRQNLNNKINEMIDTLQDQVVSLSNLRKKREAERNQLVKLSDNLKAKQQGVLATKTEQQKVLKETKQSEQEFQKILAEKQKQKVLFEQELVNLELSLKTVIDPGSIPQPQAGILSWPLDKFRITQYFGNTGFATANPQIYKGQGHNGVDMGVAMGSIVRSSAAGTVKSVGNTDAMPGCYSYGKWIVVSHSNGMSTLYGHLSAINVKAGDVVERGGIIGLSGSTGYSTGPHLHFTVFVTQALIIQPIPTSVRCKGVPIPQSSPNGYLNPLSYLPNL